MPVYSAPLRDMRFVLNDVFDYANTIASLPGYEEATPDLVDAVLEEGAKLCEELLLPLNLSGDAEGCTYENGAVRTPAGFKQAYDQFVAGGWTSLACDPAYGGQGLPKSVAFLFEEMICAANMSFGMYPGLSHGAYNALSLHASDALKALYLPKLADGSWSGTMCLTEPHSGTDLGLIRTKATPDADGQFKISGTKIFISAGEHDLTENILHLVLAKLPDAPAGTKGISLFLVPKFLPKDGPNGPEAGSRNHVRCGAIEKKMGIKASATCVMDFDGATGWLVGAPHGGMKAMFAMMNAARLGVAVQGLGVADVAYQNAAAYARDRLQGRSLTGPKYPDQAADPLVVHPDIRRMLLRSRAMTEGARALSIWTAMEIDRGQQHPDPDVRQQADDFVALMTPVMKALFTDHASEAANLAVQIHGGHGYIHDYGIEQFVRDARITQIYEGANGIQALDLVGRKMPQGGGRLLRRFFHPLQAFLQDAMKDPAMADFTRPLLKAFSTLQQVTLLVAQKGLSDPEEAGAAATDYLRLFGLVAVGWMWARMAQEALRHAGDDESSDFLADANGDGASAAFYRDKLAVGRFYMARILPETAALGLAISAGKKTLMALEDAAF